jgi:hypothetical protein
MLTSGLFHHCHPASPTSAPDGYLPKRIKQELAKIPKLDPHHLSELGSDTPCVYQAPAQDIAHKPAGNAISWQDHVPMTSAGSSRTTQMAECCPGCSSIETLRFNQSC